MDVSKLQNPSGVPTGAGGTRLAVLTILALIVVVAILYFNHQAQTTQDEGIINQDEYVNAPPVNRIPGASLDPGKLQEVKDSEIAERVVKEKDAYLHIIQESSRLVYGDMELLGIQAARSEEIKADPAAYRGKPIEIIGTLQWYEEIMDLDRKLFRGYLTSYEGDFYYFTVLDMPEALAMGTVVKLQGFFFKLYSFNIQDEDKRINDAIFLIGKWIVPSFYKMAPVWALNPEILDTLYDYDINDMVKPFEEEPLYHLLSYVKNMSDETAAMMAYEELLPMEILQHPRQHRGAPVRVLGEVVWLDRRHLGPGGENPLGTKIIYHGILCNYVGKFCYFLSFEKPDFVRVDSKDLVYIDGIFFRNYAYRTRTENLQPAPVVIARSFKKFVLPKDNTFQYISFAILGGTVLVILFFFFHVFKDRRQSMEYRDKFIARKKKQLTLSMNAAQENSDEYPPPSSASPPPE